MHTKRKRIAMKHYLSHGNLALADDDLDIVQKPQPPKLHLVQDVVEDNPEVDVVAQAKGFILRVGLSFTLCVLWFLIVLVMYQIIKPVLL